MTIAITGISSYVGTYIGNYFLKKNFKVIGISRHKPQIIHENFNFLKIDLEQESLEVECDFLIHSAGEAKLNLPFDIYYNKNIKIAYNIKRYLNKYKTKGVFFSTHKIYGQNSSLFIDENSEIISPCDYGLSKLCAERILKGQMTILRLPALIGKGSQGWLNNIIQSLNLNKNLLIYNSLFNNILHLKDLSTFIEIIFQNKIENDIFVLSSNSEVFSNEIVFYLKDKLHSTSKIELVEQNTYYFCNKKMNTIYTPMNVYETIDLFLKDLR